MAAERWSEASGEIKSPISTYVWNKVNIVTIIELPCCARLGDMKSSREKVAVSLPQRSLKSSKGIGMHVITNDTMHHR